MAAIYAGDQQTITYAVAAAVDDEQATATTLDSYPGEAPTYVFSAFFSLVYNNTVLTFRPSVPYSIDAALLAALNAASAPITSA